MTTDDTEPGLTYQDGYTGIMPACMIVKLPLSADSIKPDGVRTVKPPGKPPDYPRLQQGCLNDVILQADGKGMIFLEFSILALMCRPALLNPEFKFIPLVSRS